MFSPSIQGGGILNDPICDNKLKRVFRSPFFRKVIVTQRVVYEYLLDKKLCSVDQIQMIFGVVMPLLQNENDLLIKRRWGIGKQKLDICFMAHRYTKYGEDKGYDIFVNVAKKLCTFDENIHFHVAGPFAESIIDIDSIKDNITFHGVLSPDQFDIFFQNMDIILSPNISGKITSGSFDGFPTASCIEAALRGVAIFAVDEFKSAEGYFENEESLVIIKYDVDEIVDKLKEFYLDPLKLKMIGEAGSRQVEILYGFNRQMKSRLNLLESELKEVKTVKKIKWSIFKLNLLFTLMVFVNFLKGFFIK